MLFPTEMPFFEFDLLWDNAHAGIKLSILQGPHARRVIQGIALSDQTRPISAVERYNEWLGEKVEITCKNELLDLLTELLIALPGALESDEYEIWETAVLSLLAECFYMRHIEYIARIFKFVANCRINFVEAYKKKLIDIKLIRKFIYQLIEDFRNNNFFPNYIGDSLGLEIADLYNLIPEMFVKMEDWEQLVNDGEFSAIPALIKRITHNEPSVTTIQHAIKKSYESHATSALLRLLTMRNVEIKTMLEQIDLVSFDKSEWTLVNIVQKFHKLGIDFAAMVYKMYNIQLNHDKVDTLINKSPIQRKFDDDPEMREIFIVGVLKETMKKSAELYGQ
ncbi:MAG: hypothetical protein M1338_03940 [Patescibacteria group bacterium]|nr:hypothetical protein [Patescibacteria group bacterium]